MGVRPTIDRAGLRQHAVVAASWLAHRYRVARQYAIVLARNGSRYQRLMRLDRPIGIWLLLWPTLWALWVASEGSPSRNVFVVFVLGTILTRSAGCVINDLADRKIDAHVRRTADRPLVTGEVEPAEAVLLFAGLMLIAFALVMTLNRLTVYLAVGGALLTLIYPLMKRVFAAPQLVLGLAFAWGVPMAWAAATGGIPREGWLVYLLAIIWVLIYDTEYAMADREDDLKLGVRSTAILFGDMDRMILAALQLILLLGLGLLGRSMEMGAIYFVAIGVVALLCLRQQYLIRNRDREQCFQAFLNNAWLGGTVFAGIALDYVLRTTPPGALD